MSLVIRSGYVYSYLWFYIIKYLCAEDARPWGQLVSRIQLHRKEFPCIREWFTTKTGPKKAFLTAKAGNLSCPLTEGEQSADSLCLSLSRRLYQRPQRVSGRGRSPQVPIKAWRGWEGFRGPHKGSECFRGQDGQKDEWTAGLTYENQPVCPTGYCPQ